MTILTVMIIIAIAAFILWFGEELLRELFVGEENAVLDLRAQRNTRNMRSLRNDPAARESRRDSGVRVNSRRTAAAPYRQLSPERARYAARQTSRADLPSEAVPQSARYQGDTAKSSYGSRRPDLRDKDTYNAA